MKKLLIGLVAMTSTATASEVIPTRYINGSELTPQSVIFKSQRVEWEMAHDCDLNINAESLVDVRPANDMMPIRTARLAKNSSLVITVDGQKNICKIESINTLG